MINNKISDKNNLNQKTMKKSSGVWKGRLFLLFVVAAAVGGYFFYQYSIEKRNQDYAEALKLDNSWNIVYESEADKYVGQHIFTITEKDENGNNTWDGLILYVVDNKIQSTGKVDAISFREISEKFYGGREITSNEAMAVSKLIYDEYPLDLEDELLKDDCLFGSAKASRGTRGLEWHDNSTNLSPITVVTQGLGGLNTSGELDFATKYGGLKALGLQSAYDDNVKAILFDKLLKNPNSPYTDSNKYIVNEWNEENADNCPYISQSEVQAIFAGNIQ